MYNRMYYVGLGTILGAVLTAGTLVFSMSAAHLSIKWSDWNEKRKQK